MKNLTSILIFISAILMSCTDDCVLNDCSLCKNGKNIEDIDCDGNTILFCNDSNQIIADDFVCFGDRLYYCQDNQKYEAFSNKICLNHFIALCVNGHASLGSTCDE